MSRPPPTLGQCQALDEDGARCPNMATHTYYEWAICQQHHPTRKRKPGEPARRGARLETTVQGAVRQAVRQAREIAREKGAA